MKHLHLIRKICIFSFFLMIFLGNAQTHSYIEKFRPLSEKLSKEYGIPSSIILAIAFVETGGGSSKGAKVYHNHFGITGKNTIVKSRYKSYSSPEESFKAFCELISKKKYYSQLKGNLQPSQWIETIAKSGYTAHPTEWKRRINWVISKYQL